MATSQTRPPTSFLQRSSKVVTVPYTPHNSIMWKPGSDKPATASATGKKTTKDTPDSAKRRKTELSGATRNMRFMQRGRTPPEPSKQQKQESTPMEVEIDTTGAETTSINTSLIGASSSGEEGYMVVTPTDMYGIGGSIALGRRSFGGFNTVVAENWFRQKQEIFPKSNQRGAPKEDRKLLKQLHELKRQEKEPDRRGRKKRKNGISNGSNKRTKTLEDILKDRAPT